MFRVRSFTQDDAHLFVTLAQIETELNGVLKLVHEFYEQFGFEYKIELSTRPEKHMGDLSMWEQAEASLENVLKARGLAYDINKGDGAFYGPKIDFHILDSLGRSWQCGTVQLDFQMPEKFDCTYIGEDNNPHRPVMIHRAIYGSIERFMGILIEHYGGDFPLWLAPVQVKILPIADAHIDYANEVAQRLRQHGRRVEVDSRKEKIGLKIREATLRKAPYIVIVGDQEVANSSLAVRKRSDNSQHSLSFDDFLFELAQNR